MSTPRVSVIVPTFRRGELLAETLSSVRAQTLSDFECLVVEDGADPKTVDVFAASCEGDARFRHIVLEHSGKPGKTRNAGIRAAQGELCAFLDDDDLWLPSKLERQVALLDAEPAVGLCCTRIEEFGARSALWPSGDVPRELDFAKLVTGNFVATSTVVARRAALLGLGGFDEQLARAQDWYLWLRFALEQRIVLIDEVLCRYRTHAGNISADRRKSLDCIESILRRLHAERRVTDAQLARRLAGIYRERARHEPRFAARFTLRARGLLAAVQGRISR